MLPASDRACKKTLVTHVTKGEKYERAPLREYVASTYCSLNITRTHTDLDEVLRSAGALVHNPPMPYYPQVFARHTVSFKASKPSDSHHVLIPIMRCRTSIPH